MILTGSLTSWEGSRREQLRRACRLTLRERLIALDDMQKLANAFQIKAPQSTANN